MASESTETPFPWTLPLNPALWSLDVSPADGAGVDDDDGREAARGDGSIEGTSAGAGVVANGLVAQAVGSMADGSLAAGTTGVVMNGAANDALNRAGRAEQTTNVVTGVTGGIGDGASVVAGGAASATSAASAASASSVFGASNDSLAGGAGDGSLASSVPASSESSGEWAGAGVGPGAPGAATATASAGTTDESGALQAGAGVTAGIGEKNDEPPTTGTGAWAAQQTAADGVHASATSSSVDGTEQATRSVGIAGESSSATAMNGNASASSPFSAAASSVDRGDAGVAMDRARRDATRDLLRAIEAAGVAGEPGIADASATGAQGAVVGGAVSLDAGMSAAGAGGAAAAGAAAATAFAEAGVVGTEPASKRAGHGDAKISASSDAASTTTSALLPFGDADVHAGAGMDVGAGSAGDRGFRGDLPSGRAGAAAHAIDGAGLGTSAAQPLFDLRALASAGSGSQSDSIGADSGLPIDASHAPIVTTAPNEEQAAQIVRSLRLQWRGPIGEAQLRLTPEHLGQVLVHVRVEHGAVNATLHADTPGAQQWIQAHQQQLRDALDAQGLRVAHLHVTSDPEDRPRRERDQDAPRQPRARRQTALTDTDERRFEIRV